MKKSFRKKVNFSFGKKGVSTIVATVLIVLVSIVGAGVVGVSVYNLVSENSIQEIPSLFIENSEGYTFWDEENKTMCVQIGRGDDDADFEKLQIIFDNTDGNSKTFLVPYTNEQGIIPKINEKKVYCFNSLNEIPSSIKIAAVFSNGKVSEILDSLDLIKSGNVVGEIKLFDEYGDSVYVKEKIESWISFADKRRSLKQFALDAREDLPLWNNGENYVPVLLAQIDALPATGGEIIIPRGRYVFNQRLDIIRANVTIRAEKLGDVVFEAKDYVKESGSVYTRGDNIIFENIILYGSNYMYRHAILAWGQDNQIKNNIILNHDYGIQVKNISTGIVIKNNTIFDSWYEPIKIIGGSRDDKTNECLGIASGNLIEDNAIFDSYQAYVTLCADHNIFRNNLAVNNSLYGFRIETSDNNLFENNFAYENGEAGLSLYGYSEENQVINNTLINNGKQNIGAWLDCWHIKESLYDAYMEDLRYRPDYYPTFEKENGNFLFSNYFCQAGMHQLYFKNDIDNSVVKGNIIGGYKAPWKSDYDLAIVYYPFWYSSSSLYVSNDNLFEGNYFLDASNEKILEQGCGDIYVNNKNVNTFNWEVSDFDVNYSEVVICSANCPGKYCDVCDEDGVCEPEQGERVDNYVPERNCVDCKKKKLGESGSKRRFEVCEVGLTQTEARYPAQNGCVNVYDGSFFCSYCGNGVCDLDVGGLGMDETRCNCPEDCLE